MRPRTRLTTPPGEEPALTGTTTEAEWYSPGFAPPQEPYYPDRWQGLVVTVIAVTALVIVAVAGFRLATAGQAEDPSLQPLPTATP